MTVDPGLLLIPPAPAAWYGKRMNRKDDPEAQSGLGATEAVIVVVQPQTVWFDEVLAVAQRLEQAKYVVRDPGHVDEVLLLGAFCGQRCVGFLLCFVQVIGREEGRSVLRDASGTILREGYVDAFGVLLEYRRQGLGRRLQEHAVGLCVDRACYQIRSRSPITSKENYSLKLSLGYAIQPSVENDSYYFIRTLPRGGIRE